MTKSVTTWLCRILALALLASAMTGCMPHSCFMPCCPKYGEFIFCGKRPCVMVNYCPCIIDFAPDCCPPEEKQHTPIPREFLKPEYQRHGEYRIQIGDILEISLLTHEANSASSVIVAPDGNIYYMFLNAIPAAGRTADELAKQIEEGMTKVYVAPSVLVIPKVKAEQYYMILGKVFQPGVFPLESSIDLRQAIGNSGGITQGSFGVTTGYMANLGNSFVVRDFKRLDINFSDLIYKGDNSQNIFIRPGDYIYLGSALNQEVYVLGAVPARIAPFQQGLTLLQTLAPSYGAFSEDPYVYGNWNDVLIIRGRLCCPCVIRVDFTKILYGCAKDVYLQPGDLVYVPNQKARFGRVLIRLAIDAFMSSFISNIGQYEANRFFFGKGANGQ